MSIFCKEKKLFDELRLLNPNIVEDGIVDENEYLSSKYRIVYILKEANGGKGWSLKEFLYSGGRAQTWDNISRWTEAILNIDEHHNWSYWEKDCEKRRNIYLKKIGAINLKKEAGGHTSNEKNIHDAAVHNKEILQKQLSFCQPDIIICCGTIEPFIDAIYTDKHIEWKMTSRGIWYFAEKQKIIVSFLHPEARVKDCVLHYALLDAIKEILETIH